MVGPRRQGALVEGCGGQSRPATRTILENDQTRSALPHTPPIAASLWVLADSTKRAARAS